MGELKTVPINELKKDFPNLTQEDLEKISGAGSSQYKTYNKQNTDNNNYDVNTVDVLYFNYKTYVNEVYKIKTTASGAEKVIPKNDLFNPPNDPRSKFSKISRAVEVVFEGVYIDLQTKMVNISFNMWLKYMNKKFMNYSFETSRDIMVVYLNNSFQDMIQLTHLKIQQVMARMVPDGVYIDADGLAEIDSGNGTNYNPQEALNMFFQTGSVIGRSFTSDGDLNPGKIPIQQIASNPGSNKIASLISTYNYYLQMMRDATGLNEARDGSNPDKNALVGVQKLAAMNSNTATRHILQSGLFLTAETAEKISLRISDIIEYSPTKDAFIQQIGVHNVATLSELDELHLYDFGIYINLMPDEEEKQLLENNLQVALSAGLIDLDDAIDVREIKNLKLANQMLKIRKGKKQLKDQQIQQQNIQAQSQANAQAQQVAAQAEVQKQQALTASKIQLEQAKAGIDSNKLVQEAQLKKELMQLEFSMNMQLRDNDLNLKKKELTEKEDRKDDRTRLVASQQSELIDQRKNNLPPKNFESSGNDIISGNFNLGSFEPK